MSTKIYSGYKVPLSKLGLAIEFFRVSMWRRVVASMRPSTMDELRKLREEHAECGFHVWVDTKKQEALFCLFGLPIYTEEKGRKGFEDFVLPSWVEDFSYWNNTDPPEEMTRARWEARGKQWNRVALDRGWQDRMTNVVLPRDGYEDMSLAYELLAGFRESWGIKEEDLLSRRKLPK